VRVVDRKLAMTRLAKVRPLPFQCIQKAYPWHPIPQSDRAWPELSSPLFTQTEVQAVRYAVFKYMRNVNDW